MTYTTPVESHCENAPPRAVSPGTALWCPNCGALKPRYEDGWEVPERDCPKPYVKPRYPVLSAEEAEAERARIAGLGEAWGGDYRTIVSPDDYSATAST